MTSASLSDQEFALFQKLIYKIAGISLSEAKKVMLAGRLMRRLKALNLQSFSAYYRLLAEGNDPDELQMMVDLLTTNETYFFREAKHLDFLRDHILPQRGTPPFRVWSAASSSGEEAYSIAMTLAEAIGETSWEIVGSDICTRVLEKAVRGHYALDRTDGIPPGHMRKYCLKGVRAQAGTFLIVPELRQRTRFYQINLMHPVDAGIGDFDVIFLRNVMIYFDPPTKAKVVNNLLPRLKRGGHLIIGHSETLTGIVDSLVTVRPTIYRKP